jgi:hypothetical protein
MRESDAKMVEKDSGTYICSDSIPSEIQRRIGFWSVLEMDVLI